MVFDWEVEEQELRVLPTAESSSRMDGGRGMFTFPFPFLPFFCSFPDASTMEVTTSPNKKSDNKLHWIRMQEGWMLTRVVD